jgi:hypothetical protein
MPLTPLEQRPIPDHLDTPPQKNLHNLPPPIRFPPSALCSPLSAIRSPPPAIRSPPLAVCYLLFAIRHLLSSISPPPPSPLAPRELRGNDTGGGKHRDSYKNANDNLLFFALLVFVLAP